MTDVWDQFSPPPTATGDFPEPFKWDQIGANIAGEIIEIRTADFDGQIIPDLWIRTEDGDRSVLCGPANLRGQLLDLRPNVGDRIAISYVSQKKATKGFAKLFDVALERQTVYAPKAKGKAADLL